jgi:pilus assembly protein Flp/PilA
MLGIETTCARRHWGGGPNNKGVTMFTFFSEQSALANDRRGVTALEYGLIAGLIAVVIVGSVTALGTQLSGTFSAIVSALP